jgi:hypothetical protein
MNKTNFALSLHFMTLSLILSGLYLVYTIQTNSKKDIKFPNTYVIPDFDGYDYPKSKKSGVGGGLILENPLPLDVPSELVDGIFN